MGRERTSGQAPGRATGNHNGGAHRVLVQRLWTSVLGSERLTSALLDRLTDPRSHPDDERRQPLLVPHAVAQIECTFPGEPIDLAIAKPEFP